jgi:hypothetical protein
METRLIDSFALDERKTGFRQSCPEMESNDCRGFPAIVSRDGVERWPWFSVNRFQTWSRTIDVVKSDNRFQMWSRTIVVANLGVRVQLWSRTTPSREPAVVSRCGAKPPLCCLSGRVQTWSRTISEWDDLAVSCTGDERPRCRVK